MVTCDMNGVYRCQYGHVRFDVILPLLLASRTIKNIDDEGACVSMIGVPCEFQLL